MHLLYMKKFLCLDCLLLYFRKTRIRGSPAYRLDKCIAVAPDAPNVVRNQPEDHARVAQKEDVEKRLQVVYLHRQRNPNQRQVGPAAAIAEHGARAVSIDRRPPRSGRADGQDEVPKWTRPNLSSLFMIWIAWSTSASIGSFSTTVKLGSSSSWCFRWVFVFQKNYPKLCEMQPSFGLTLREFRNATKKMSFIKTHNSS